MEKIGDGNAVTWRNLESMLRATLDVPKLPAVEVRSCGLVKAYRGLRKLKEPGLEAKVASLKELCDQPENFRKCWHEICLQ